jgi:DNA-binding FrmR family transcriptional regulator
MRDALIATDAAHTELRTIAGGLSAIKQMIPDDRDRDQVYEALDFLWERLRESLERLEGSVDDLQRHARGPVADHRPNDDKLRKLRAALHKYDGLMQQAEAAGNDPEDIYAARLRHETLEAIASTPADSLEGVYIKASTARPSRDTGGGSLDRIDRGALADVERIFAKEVRSVSETAGEDRPTE